MHNCRPRSLQGQPSSLILTPWGFPGEGASNESVIVENGDFRFFRSLVASGNVLNEHDNDDDDGDFPTAILSCV